MKYTFQTITGMGLVLFIFLMTSCEKDYLVPNEAILPDSVFFQNNVVPIFEASCNASGCHNTGGVAPDLTPDYAYDELTQRSLVDTADAESSVLYVRMTATSKPMPPTGALKNGEPELILKWIQQGAQNN